MRVSIIFIALIWAFITVGQGSLKEVFLQSKMDGQKTLPDGTEIEFWGYGIENQLTGLAKISLPGPILRFDLGDTVRIQLRNTSPEAHTIHWHGLDVDQANDGVGHTSNNVIPNDLFIYEFVCTHSGTYMYHCHVLTPLHLAMGMYGLFIVNGEEEQFLYDETSKFTKEFSFLFSEMNVSWNDNPLSPGDFALYEADFLMVNGMSDLEAEFSDNEVIGTENDTLAFRLANIGYGSVEVNFPNELMVKAIASDGRVIPALETGGIVLYPGERYDFIALPLEPFVGNILVNYFDLRNNNLLGTNNIPITITSTVGLNGFNLADGNIYPNPFSTSIFIESDAYPKIVEISTFSGEIVRKLHIQSAVEIDLQTLESGVYTLRIGDKIHKIIKL
jgi:hypothetical protein